MATIFCANGGSNTSPYDTWAKAATSLQTAITQAADGDVIVVQYDAPPAADQELAGNTNYAFDAHCSLVTASNDGGASYTLTPMGTTAWIGNSTTARTVTLGGAFRCLIYGLTLRIASNLTTTFNVTDGGHFEGYEVLLWSSATAANTTIFVGNVNNSYTKLVNSTIRFDRTGGSANPAVNFGGHVELENCTFDFAAINSTPPLNHVGGSVQTTRITMTGCDLTDLSTTAMIGNNDRSPGEWRLIQCKLPSSFSVFASQTSAPNKGSNQVWVLDSHSGDTHNYFEYHDAFGSLTLDSGIYFTSGAAGASWKIVTTANCSYRTPFISPMVPPYNTGTSAVTPYFEILRDGSTTAYTDAEVWGIFSAKTTSGSTRAGFANDGQSLAAFLAGTTASNQAAGAGTGSWTGEGGSAWSGKVDSGSSLTPAENGSIIGRVAVGAASITVYVDPQIRT
jgi:hypothetical protein